MSAELGARDLCSAALDAIVAKLREAVAVERCTLRLQARDEFYPVAHESRAPSVRSLIGDHSVPLQGQPVVEAILAGAEQVVQPDTRAASCDPAFQEMLIKYGGLGAQIVTPVRDGERLLGIISLHHLGAPREWTERELALARTAAALVAPLVGMTALGAGV
ncbi:MAG: GAF domain-containing protein [Solirubrobacterales bacterium]|nr:GAF domain-containing protein [Solirubrobacterales bacterium]